jgi:hypothetical protein
MAHRMRADVKLPSLPTFSDPGNFIGIYVACRLAGRLAGSAQNRPLGQIRAGVNSRLALRVTTWDSYVEGHR